jgi:hypothetical protein
MRERDMGTKIAGGEAGAKRFRVEYKRGARREPRRRQVVGFTWPRDLSAGQTNAGTKYEPIPHPFGAQRPVRTRLLDSIGSEFLPTLDIPIGNDGIFVIVSVLSRLAVIDTETTALSSVVKTSAFTSVSCEFFTMRNSPVAQLHTEIPRSCSPARMYLLPGEIATQSILCVRV